MERYETIDRICEDLKTEINGKEETNTDNMTEVEQLVLEIKRHYLCKAVKGWTRIDPLKSYNMQGYGTRRIAKLYADGELQFTIGATELGHSASLNGIIEKAVASAGLQFQYGKTTSGSGRAKPGYPAFSINGVSPDVIMEILNKVRDAAVTEASRP
jgi:hypothetical protein